MWQCFRFVDSKILTQLCVKFLFSLSPLPLSTFLGGNDADYIALMRNPEFDVDSLRDIGYPDNAELEKNALVRVLLPEQAQVTDIRTGKSFGMVDQVTVELDPWSPIILELHRNP